MLDCGVRRQVGMSGGPAQRQRTESGTFETPYDRAAVQRTVLEGLVMGKTLRAICREEHEAGAAFPCEHTIRLWSVTDHDFRGKFIACREVGLFAIADEMIDLADEAGDPQRSRLKVETRKWLVGKLLPTVFGEGGARATLPIDMSRLSDEQVHRLAAGESALAVLGGEAARLLVASGEDVSEVARELEAEEG